MWYTNENKKILDYNKPIIAEDRNEKYLLLPHIQKGSYKVVGFNWFNLKDGAYSSSITFKTVEEALSSRNAYKIYNAEISINKI